MNRCLCDTGFCSPAKEGWHRQIISLGGKMLSVFGLCVGSKDALNDLTLLLSNVHALFLLSQYMLLT